MANTETDSISTNEWVTVDDESSKSFLNTDYNLIVNGEFPSVSVDRMTNLNQIENHREDHTIVWLDPLIDPEDLRTQEIVIKMSDTCKVCNDITECQNYLKTAFDQTILITSGSCAVQCLKLFDPIPSVNSILIYCAKPEKYAWIKKVYKKVVACIQTEADLIEHVHRLMTIKCQTPFYTINQTKSNAAIFICLQILFGILLQSPVITKQAREEMIHSLKHYYHDNHAELAKIKEFQETYDPKNAIQWYTKNSFIHKTVNKALRTENIDMVYRLRSYILDLYNQLADVHTHSSLLPKTNESGVLTLYRGTQVPLSELNKLLDNKGNLITANGFLSASRSYEVAIAFAQGLATTNYASALFEIKADLTTSKPLPFADISKHSDFPEEQEILFNLGTIFRVDSGQYNAEKKVWLICLSLILADEGLDVRPLSALFQFGSPQQNQLSRSLFHFWLDDHFYKDYDIKAVKAYYHYLLKLGSLNIQSHLLIDVNDYMEDKRLRRIVSSDHPHDFLAKMNGTYLQEYIINDTENTILNNSVNHPVFCFDIRNDQLNKEKKRLCQVFFEFQTKFVIDLTEIIQIALQCQSKNQQLYLISSDSVPPELKSFETKMIRIYYLNEDVQQTIRKEYDGDQLNQISVNTIEQLINRLYHDLARFYSKAAEQVPHKEQSSLIAEYFLLKSVRYYELLAQNTKDIIQRYRNSLK